MPVIQNKMKHTHTRVSVCEHCLKANKLESFIDSFSLAQDFAWRGLVPYSVVACTSWIGMLHEPSFMTVSLNSISN